MPPFFDDLDGCYNFRQRELKKRSAGSDERCQACREHQRKGINGPNSIVIVVVGVRDLGSRPFSGRYMNGVEMRVNDSGIIVIRSRTARVNVLKRRQKEGQ